MIQSAGEPRVRQDRGVDEQDGDGSLETRLAALRTQVEQGLPKRAEALRDAVARLAGGDHAARTDIRRHAHKLHGTAGSFGLEEMGARAAELEHAADDASIEDGAIADSALALARAIEGARVLAPEIAPARASLAGARVLAIDDDVATRKLLELTLCSIGRCDARIVASADDALARLADGDLDLVIVDAMMPMMSGLELATKVRASARNADVPIAFLSAAAHEELGWQLPPRSTWLRKPFRPGDLLDRLSALVHGAAAP